MYPENFFGGVPFPAGSLGSEAHGNLKGYMIVIVEELLPVLNIYGCHR